MQRQISVVLEKGQEFSFHVPDGVALAHDAARAWLDSSFWRWTVSRCAPAARC
jgi:hypothetical protein